jgi:uncharacterized protein DUF4349
MPSPDLIAPDRLEELLGGALPEAEHEARIQGLVRELRAEAPAAPEQLRTRVGRLASSPPPPRWAFLRRGPALAFAVVILMVAGVGSLIAFAPETSGDDESEAGVAAADTTGGAAQAEEDGGEDAPAAAPSAEQDGAQRTGALLGDAADVDPFVPQGRATDVDLWMEVRLKDADEVSAAASDSMAIARELGGWVAASDIDTRGREGKAELALRVPVGKVEDAVVQLSALGTVTGETVETTDLQAGIDRRLDQIERIERAIRVLELKLDSGTLTPVEELDTRLQLERQRTAIADLRRDNRGDYREAATSELELVLHTREAAAAGGEDDDGAAGAARDALGVLAVTGTIALFLVIVLSPVVLVAFLVWLLLRGRSRRIEAQLLDRADPASPSS